MSLVEAPLSSLLAVRDGLQQQQKHQHQLSSQGIDPVFIYPENQRWTIPYDCFDANLPVIDLAPVLNLMRLRKEIEEQTDSEANRNIEEEIEQCENAKLSVQRQIRVACEEIGFFQVVNHGFPMHLVQQLTDSVEHIFDLPLEEKIKATQIPASKDKPMRSPGYQPLNRVNTYLKAKKSWNEAFDMDLPEVMYPGRLQHSIDNLWPEEPERSSKGLQLRSAGDDYSKEANRLAVCLLNLMAGSLGLPEGTFGKFLGWGPEQHLEARLNVLKYLICPQPELTFGVVGHTDPSLITLVHQDIVGGLQVRFKDGNWHGIKPIPNAFVVNVGNFLQTCTNGRFISAEHRVVANNKAERRSIVYFVLDRMDCVFSPMPELLDAEHPPLYRPFSRREFLQKLKDYGQAADMRMDNPTKLFRHHRSA